MAKDIARIESSMKRLHQSLTTLASSSDFDEFFRIIHFPGWTTIIDEYFVLTMIEAMEGQMRNVSAELANLMKGARMIGETADKSR